MDDLFEQMLSVSPWVDGAAMSRAAWDGSAMTTSNCMVIDSINLQRMSPGHLAGGVENQAPSHDCNEGVSNGESVQVTSNKAAVPLQFSHPHHTPLTSTGESVQVTSNKAAVPPQFSHPHHTPLPLTNNSTLPRVPPKKSPAFTTSNRSEDQRLLHNLLSAPGMAGTWRPPFASNITLIPPGLGQGEPDSFLSVDAMTNELHPGKRLREDEDMTHGEQAHEQDNGDQLSPFGHNHSGAARPRVRARRGQATDPHSIAERNRRERIAERMKALQELVPDSNKTDKASMLDEIIGYVKFLQMQVKCLSMCRLGSAGAAAPLLADLPAEGAASFLAANLAQVNGAPGTSHDGIAFAERQVARLMDEDMSAAMQYLQSKGLCLMPISLATAISSSGGASKHHSAPLNGSDTGRNEQAVDGAPGVAKETNRTPMTGNDDLEKMKEVVPGALSSGGLAMPGPMKRERPS